MTPKRPTSRFWFWFWELLRDSELEPGWDLNGGAIVQLSPPPPPPPADCRVVITSPRRSRRSDRALLLFERKEEDEGHPEEGEDSAVRKGRKGGSVSSRVFGVVEEIQIGSNKGDESAELAVAISSSSTNNRLSSSAREEKSSRREAVEERAGIEIKREIVQA